MLNVFFQLMLFIVILSPAEIIIFYESSHYASTLNAQRTPIADR